MTDCGFGGFQFVLSLDEDVWLKVVEVSMMLKGKIEGGIEEKQFEDVLVELVKGKMKGFWEAVGGE